VRLRRVSLSEHRRHSPIGSAATFLSVSRATGFSVRREAVACRVADRQRRADRPVRQRAQIDRVVAVARHRDGDAGVTVAEGSLLPVSSSRPADDEGDACGDCATFHCRSAAAIHQ